MRENILPFAAYGLIAFIVISVAGQVGNMGQYILMFDTSGGLPGALYYIILTLSSLFGITFQLVAWSCSTLGVATMAKSQARGLVADVSEGFSAYRHIFPILVTNLPIVAAFIPNAILSGLAYKYVLEMESSSLSYDAFFSLLPTLMFVGIIGLIAAMTVSVLFCMAPFYVVYENLTGGQALSRSYQVCKGNFLGILGMLTFNVVIYFFGFLCCCVGVFFAFPYISIVMLLAFRDLTNIPLIPITRAESYSPYPREFQGDMPPAPPEETR